jgi:hypothetical protein
MESFERLSRALGDDGPEVFLKVATPSGGLHLYIAATGIGSRKFREYPGIDFKSGKKDGSSRGFVFMPPTARPAKIGPRTLAGPDRIPYRPKKLLPFRFDDDKSVQFIRDFVSRLGAGPGAASGRPSLDSLKDECMEAPAGAQREVLLSFVLELEKRGEEPGRIEDSTLELMLEMPSFDKHDPYADNRRTRQYIRSLLHDAGVIIPDETDPENRAMLRNMPKMRPMTAGLVRSLDSVVDERVEWLAMDLLAFRELTLLDGEKGVGKSFTVDWFAACASRGLGFPGVEVIYGEAIDVMIFTDEGNMASITKQRIKVAGGDLGRIKIPGIKVPRGKDKSVDWELALPDGAEMIGKMIAESGARLAIFDPITDFMGEDINTHNDAQVRRALRPLALELDRAGCSGLAIRHMNKDTRAEAKYRGSGSTAFQNRARIHLIARELPLSAGASGVPGKFGIAMIDTNLAPRREGALCYDIIDSSQDMDDLGNKVGMCQWHGWFDVDLKHGDRPRHGPAPSAERESLELLLTEMFSERDTWGALEAQAEIDKAGLLMNKNTVAKVLKDIGVRRARSFDGRGALVGWVWTVKKESVAGRRTHDGD